MEELAAPQYSFNFDDDTENVVKGAETSADVLNSLTNKVLSSVNNAAPEIDPVSDTEVKLPAGLITQNGVVRVAEVQELTGRHEEALAKVRNNPSKFINTLLLSGVVSIGDEKISQKLIDKLLQGDIDALLLGIRKVTFGDDFEMYGVPCDYCGELNDLTLSLASIPVQELEDPEILEYEVPLRKGRKARVTFPTGEAQKELYRNAELTAPELVTILLEHCVLGFISATGTFTPARGKTDILDLGKLDRDAIQKFIYEKQPGLRYDQVTAACSSCEREVLVPLNVAILFRDI